MPKVRNTILYCCACVAAVAAGALGGTYYYGMSHKAEVIEFVGKDISIARDWASKNRVADRMVYTYEYDEDNERDIILRQSLRAGVSLGSDQFLNLSVSKGADPDKEFELIDFSGKKEKEIRAWFEERKFSDVVFEYRYTDEDQYSEGSFISMKPESIKKAKRSDHLEITVATKKSEDIRVGDLTLYSLDNLAAWAEENKLSLNLVWAYDDSPYGTIIASDPPAGSKVHTSDEITVTVSAGREPQESENIDVPVAVVDPVQPEQETASTPTPTPRPTPTPTPRPTPTPTPAPTPTPTPEPTPTPTPTPEPAPTPTPEIVYGGCPVSIISSIFTNATAADVIAYYGSNNCEWNVIEYADSSTNPNNYMGVAGYEVNGTQTSANLYMYVRWQ